MVGCAPSTYAPCGSEKSVGSIASGSSLTFSGARCAACGDEDRAPKLDSVRGDIAVPRPSSSARSEKEDMCADKGSVGNEVAVCSSSGKSSALNSGVDEDEDEPADDSGRSRMCGAGVSEGAGVGFVFVCARSPFS